MSSSSPSCCPLPVGFPLPGSPEGTRLRVPAGARVTACQSPHVSGSRRVCVLLSPSWSLGVHRMEEPKLTQLEQEALNHTVSQWTHLHTQTHKIQRHPCKDRCTQNSHVGTCAHFHPHPLLVSGYFKFSVGEEEWPPPTSGVGWELSKVLERRGKTQGLWRHSLHTP